MPARPELTGLQLIAPSVLLNSPPPAATIRPIAAYSVLGFLESIASALTPTGDQDHAVAEAGAKAF